MASVAFVLLLVVARSWNRRLVEDISLWDETLYLANGVSFFRAGPPAAEWGPLYSILYWLESLVVPDRVELYYLHWSVLLFANLAVALVLLRAIGVGALASVGALAVLSTASIFEATPSVSLLASALAGLALAATLRIHSASRALSFAATLFALGTFVRPELVAAFAVTFVAGGVAALTGRERARVRVVRFLTPAAVLVALALAFGNPLSGPRSLSAFGQHFALNVKNAAGEPLDWADWQPTFFKHFGAVRSVVEAVRVNPEGFRWHVGQNVRAIGRNALMPLEPRVGLPGPLTIAISIVLTSLTAVGVVLACVAGARALRRPSGAPRAASGGAAFAVVAVAVIAPSLASVLLVHPRDHYLATPFLVVIAVALLGWRAAVERVRARLPSSTPWRAAALAAAALLLLPARTSAVPWYAAGAGEGRRADTPNAALVEALRRFRQSADGRLAVLEHNLGTGVYAGWSSRSLDLGECFPFRICLRDGKFDVALIDASLAGFYRRLGDRAFFEFVKDPGPYAFERLPLESSDAILIARRGVIAGP